MPKINLSRWAWILAGIGWSSFFCYLAFQQSALTEERKSWPTVEGVILESKTVESTDQIEYKVTFEYEVEGTRYENSEFFDEFEADYRIPEQHKRDRRVTVYYDPDHPDTALLDPSTQVWILYMIASIPIVISLPFLFLWGLHLYIRYQMSVARYHLDKARTLIAEGNELLREHVREGGVADDEIVEKAVGLMTEASQVEAMLDGLDREIEAETVDNEESAETISEAHDSADPPPSNSAHEGRIESSHVEQGEHIKQVGLGGALIAGLVPLLMGTAISWFVPYYSITCTRDSENNVGVEIQQILYALFPVGEPEQLVDLQSVEDFREGTSRTKQGYLRFEGDRSVEIRASRSILTATRIREYLNSEEIEPLRASDGAVFWGLFVPWAIGLFGLVAAIISMERGTQSPIEQDGTNSARLPSGSPANSFLVPFVMGSYVTVCLAGLVFVTFVDVMHASTLIWLGLIGVSVLGGLINVVRSRRHVDSE